MERSHKLVSEFSNFISTQKYPPPETAGIVFSRDRAMQLHALLTSYRNLVRGGPKLALIFRATNSLHERAYWDVINEFSDLLILSKIQVDRKSFKQLLIDVLSIGESENIFFLTDDNLFIEPIDMCSLAVHASSYSIPSFRLGENIKHSYTVQKNNIKPNLKLYQPSPNSVTSEMDILSWVWGGGDLDFGYPISLDGHIFQRNEILAMTEFVDFDSPNTYENNLQIFNPIFETRIGICFRKSRLLNIPYNKVQTDFQNIHGDVDPGEMLRLWNEGFRIDATKYRGTLNRSIHMDMPLLLKNCTK